MKIRPGNPYPLGATWDGTGVRFVVRLRATHPVLSRRRFSQRRNIRGLRVKDMAWFSPDGEEMNDVHSNAHFARCLGMRLVGSEILEMDPFGDPISGATLSRRFNALHEANRLTLPGRGVSQHWERLMDTAQKAWDRHGNDQTYRMGGRAVVELRLAEIAGTTEEPGGTL